MSSTPGPYTHVIVGPQGLAYVGLHDNEADAWRIYLGWPTVGEVKHAQANGWYCTRAELKWTDPKQAAPSGDAA